MFRWRYLSDAEEDLGRSEGFPEQEEAEAWMGEAWQDLRDRGVEAVELWDDDRGDRVYRMGLEESRES
jgi:hypothetical protein